MLKWNQEEQFKMSAENVTAPQLQSNEEGSTVTQVIVNLSFTKKFLTLTGLCWKSNEIHSLRSQSPVHTRHPQGHSDATFTS